MDQIDNGKYVKAVSKWKQMDIKTVSDLEAVLSNFSVIFAYHSGVIENPEITYHTTREILQAMSGRCLKLRIKKFAMTG